MSATKPRLDNGLVNASETIVDTTEDVELEAQAMARSQLLVSKLSPTPSQDPCDPLNWPLWVKITVLTQTSLLAALGGLNTATINPALVQLSQEFHISVVRASYQTTVCIALNGVAPFLWIPLAHRYGRRPIWLATTLLGFASILGCAYAKTYTQLIVARIFNGFFPVGFALGATTVVDLFFYHQRGRAMGFFTVTVVNGSHLAPIVGGLLGQYCGWRWIFKFAAIADAVMLVVAFFCLPETMYTRPQIMVDHPLTSAVKHEPGVHTAPSCTSSVAVVSMVPSRSSGPSTKIPMYRHAMRLDSFNPNASLNPASFFLPTIKLFVSPSAIFPAIYYASMYGFASILPAVTVAAIFTEFFHWNTLTIGLTYGASLTIGGILGEVCAGWICDYVVNRALLANPSNQHTIPPELRLLPIWPGVIITPIGLLLYGFTLHYHTAPVLPLVGMGLSCFGLQIITTTTYTYAIDCHKEQSAEVAALFNLIRQCFGMTFAFYVVKMGHRIGFQWTFVFFVCCGSLAFLPVLGLIVHGKRLRAQANSVRI